MPILKEGRTQNVIRVTWEILNSIRWVQFAYGTPPWATSTFTLIRASTPLITVFAHGVR